MIERNVHATDKQIGSPLVDDTYDPLADDRGALMSTSDTAATVLPSSVPKATTPESGDEDDSSESMSTCDRTTTVLPSIVPTATTSISGDEESATISNSNVEHATQEELRSLVKICQVGLANPQFGVIKFIAHLSMNEAQASASAVLNMLKPAYSDENSLESLRLMGAEASSHHTTGLEVVSFTRPRASDQKAMNILEEAIVNGTPAVIAIIRLHCKTTSGSY